MVRISGIAVLISNGVNVFFSSDTEYFRLPDVLQCIVQEFHLINAATVVFNRLCTAFQYISVSFALLATGCV